MSTRHRRVFFFPGSDEEDPYVALYCGVHAMDLLRTSTDDEDDDYHYLEDVEHPIPTTTVAGGAGSRRPSGTANFNNKSLVHASNRSFLLPASRRVSKDSSGLLIRSSTGGDGGGSGHSKDFGRSSSNSLLHSPTYAQDSKKLMRMRLLREQGKRGRLMQRPHFWNSIRSRQWKDSWRARKAAASAKVTATLASTGLGDSSKAASASDHPMPFENPKQLLHLITTDLVNQLKMVEDPAKRADATKSIQFKWKRQVGEKLSAEQFKKLFDRARVDATKEIENPGPLSESAGASRSNSFTLNNNRSANDGERAARSKIAVDVNSFLDGMDPAQTDIAKSMIETLSNAIGRLNEPLNDTVAQECAKETRNKLRRTYMAGASGSDGGEDGGGSSSNKTSSTKKAALSADEFKRLWIAARKVVARMYRVRLNAPKAQQQQEPHNTDVDVTTSFQHSGKRKNPPSESAMKENPNGHGNKDGSMILDWNRNGESGNIHFTSAMKELYHDTVQSIIKGMATKRHLPLQTYLEEEEEKCRYDATGGARGEDGNQISQLQFEQVWRRARLQIQQMHRAQIVSRASSISRKQATRPLTTNPTPMDWSFLIVGKPFDSVKNREYLSNWDVVEGGEEDVDGDEKRNYSI